MAAAACFDEFLVADEVDQVMKAFEGAVGLIPGTTSRQGLDLFEEIRQVFEPCLSFRAKKIFGILQTALVKRQDFRTGDDAKVKVLVSGAGPVGLRTAVECALLGQRVVVVEKRKVFSRVNILLFWGDTMQDMVALGAKYFYPELRVHGDILHMGTREIQLCLLKVCLLLGVKVHYGSELTGLATSNSEWNVVVAEKGTAAKQINMKRLSQKTMDVLGFKKNKMDDYQMTFHCNLMDDPKVDPVFLQTEMGNAAIPFNALVIAEGEWSQTSRKLGFTKTIDKFKQAIGMVLNLDYDKSNPVEKKLQSYKSSMSPIGHPVVAALLKKNILVENIEYLKGSTHYIVVTICKSSLLENKVLIQDAKSSKELLSNSNLNMDSLKQLAREIATTSGVPSSAPFCEANPIQLFDFSSRARAFASIRFLDGHGPTVHENPDDIQGDAVAPAFLVGDAALEPFWPQGLGSNRGFHCGLDAAFAINQWIKFDLQTCYREREFAYTAMNAYSWMGKGPTKATQPFECWTPDPTTRYGRASLKAARELHLTKKANIPVTDRILKLKLY